MRVERGHPRILVVEDDVETARLVERRLQRDGYHTEHTADPTTVIDACNVLEHKKATTSTP